MNDSYPVLSQGSIGRSVSLALMAGLVQLLVGLLKCGVVFDLVTPPVLTGFVAASVITIATGQIKNWLGLPHVGRDFVHAVSGICSKIGETREWDAVLGVVCIAAFVGFHFMSVR